MIKKIITGESGGPTPVIDWEVAGIVAAAQKAGIKILGMINGLEGLLHANIEGNIVDLSSIDPMVFVFNGPGAGLRTTRIKPTAEQYQRIAQNLAALGIDGVIYIGGNDSADQLLGLTSQCQVRAIHAIKTVDNDLPVTHHCPGYGSATLYNATAIKNVYNDFSSYRVWGNFEKDGKVVQGLSTAPVVIYQVMGRKAGWLAQGTALAKVDLKAELVPDQAPHLVLSKEVPFDRQIFLDTLDRVISKLGEAVIVVQEDLTDKRTGKDLAELYATSVDTDAHGNIQHGRATSFSPAIFLAQLIKSELKVASVYGEVKETALAPQHVQRSYLISPVDASEAYQVGFASVRSLLDGATKKSVILERRNGKTLTGLTDLKNIAAQERKMPLNYIDGLNGPTQEFVDEFIYLLGGPAALPYYSSRQYKPVPVPSQIRAHPYVKPKK